MTVLDAKLRDAAKATLDKYGTSVTWHSIAKSGYTPASGSAASSDTAHSVKISPPSPVTGLTVGNDAIEDGEANTNIAAKDLAFTPAIGDEVEIDGERWVAQQVSPVYSGDLVAIYKVRLRK